MNNEIINQALQILIPALATLIAGWFASLAAKLKGVYEQKAKDENAKIIIDNVVRFVEQIYNDLSGEEKLKIAIKKASALLEEKGIFIGEAELNMLIESAVYGLKEGMSQPLQITTSNIIKESDNEG